MLKHINPKVHFADSITLDRMHKQANLEQTLKTIAKAQKWEAKGLRKASKCLIVVQGDEVKKAVAVARKQAIEEAKIERINAQKQAFLQMFPTGNIE